MLLAHEHTEKFYLHLCLHFQSDILDHAKIRHLSKTQEAIFELKLEQSQ